MTGFDDDRNQINRIDEAGISKLLARGYDILFLQQESGALIC